MKNNVLRIVFEEGQEETVALASLSPHLGSSGQAFHLTIKPNSKITLKDDLISLGIHHCSVTAEIQKKASLNFEARFLCPILISEAKDKQCQNFSGDHHEVVRKIHFELTGTGASVCSKIRFAGGKRRVLNLDVTNDHQASGTRSDVSVKTVLDSGAQLVCNMLTKAGRDICDAVVRQENKNLVLGEDVKIKAIPSLKIKTDSAKCSHSSATGMVDSETLFYLQSRGLDIENAKTVLVGAYLI